MNDYPLISVIIPVYKAEKYLDHCVDSIVNQTYKNLEIILVDDGSPDNCPKMCDDWAAKDCRIKVIHKQNGGASSARNCGLDCAKGDYIAFIDSDDYIDEDMYEIMLGQIKEHNADAASCGMVRESADGAVEVWGDNNAPVNVLDNTALLKSVGKANGILPVSPCNKLFSKSIIADIRFDIRFRFAEDVLFNYMVAENINKIVCQDVPRYHYVSNDSSVSHNEFDENRFDEHRVMDLIFERAKNNPEIYADCVKGDVAKSFRTIKEMCASGNCTDRFKEIRNRIVAHKKEIIFGSTYSKAMKVKTAFLWLLPDVYKVFIKKYANKYN